MRWPDRIIAVVLGLVLGAGIVVGFVFWGSEKLVDAPSLGSDGRGHGQHAHGGKHGGGGRPEPPVKTVHVVGCAPSESGAPTLDYRKGDHVRIEVVSDATCGLEVFGYGVTRTVPANEPTLIEFDATKPGNFPLIVTASHIGVADIRIDVGPGL